MIRFVIMFRLFKREIKICIELRRFIGIIVIFIFPFFVNEEGDCVNNGLFCD